MKIKFNLGFTSQIIIAAILGVVWGMVFKGRSEFVSTVNNVMVALLQMSCIPYMITSLICGFGGFNIERGKKTFFSFIFLVLGIWIVLFLICYLYYITVYPETHIHTFFSNNVYKGSENLIEQFLPINPFYSLANSFIPSIVFFFSCLGIAIAFVPGKEKVLKPMNALLEGITKLTLFILRFLPILVFTSVVLILKNVDVLDKFNEFMPFLIGVVLGNLLIIFGVYPLIAICLTDIRYREFVYEFKEIFITAFATGNSMIVLPLIVEKLSKISLRHNIKNKITDEVKASIVMISFNMRGALLTALTYLFFAAWFSGINIRFYQLPSLFFYAITSIFGGDIFSVITLLNLLKIPHDMLLIYLICYNALFLDNLLTVSNVAFICLTTIIVMFVCNNRIKLKFKLLIKSVLIGISALAIIFLVCRAFFSSLNMENKYTSIIEKMSVKNQVNSLFLNDVSELKQDIDAKTNDLSEIINRKVIIFGYKKDSPPFSFRNKKGQIVGYNIALANEIAKSLNCSAIFVPHSDYNEAYSQVKAGKVDVVFTQSNDNMLGEMASISVSDPYLYVTPGLLVKDQMAEKFQNWKSVMSDKALMFSTNSFFIKNLQGDLKQLFNEKRLINVDNISDFLNDRVDASAYIISVEEGAYWGIINPAYTVVIPEGIDFVDNRFLNMTIRFENKTLKDFLNYWIKVKISKKTLDSLYKYWIEGKIEEKAKLRKEVF